MSLTYTGLRIRRILPRILLNPFKYCTASVLGLSGLFLKPPRTNSFEIFNALRRRMSGQDFASSVKFHILVSVGFLRSCLRREEKAPRSDCGCPVWCHTYCFTLLSKLDQLGRYRCGIFSKRLVSNKVSESSHFCGNIFKHAVPDAS